MYDKAAYKSRNVVERTINKLRQTRAVATQYDKREFVYRGTIDVASITIWLHTASVIPQITRTRCAERQILGSCSGNLRPSGKR